jgi:hypothetical protein
MQQQQLKDIQASSEQQQQLQDIQASSQQQQQQRTTAPTVKKFGSWFPSATTVKGAGHVTCNVCICLFYQYRPPHLGHSSSALPHVVLGQVHRPSVERAAAAQADPGDCCSCIIADSNSTVTRLCNHPRLNHVFRSCLCRWAPASASAAGRVLLAKASTAPSVARAPPPTPPTTCLSYLSQRLRHDALLGMVAALQGFHSAFLSTDFKFIKDLPPSQHFPQLNVFPVKELVTYGIRQAAEAPLSQVSSCGVRCVCPGLYVDGWQGGVHLPPQEFHKAMEKDNTVSLDDTYRLSMRDSSESGHHRRAQRVRDDHRPLRPSDAQGGGSAAH